MRTPNTQLTSHFAAPVPDASRSSSAAGHGSMSQGAADVLVERAKGGDLGAFEALLRRHEHAVLRTAWRLLGRREDAEDVAQEVFLRLHRHLDRIDPERSLGAWLYRVTVNACRNLGRSRARRRDVPLDDAATSSLVAGPGSDPAAAARLAEERRMVDAGLATLSDKERAALVLRDVEGLSTAEVAEILGSSPVTVRTHVCRARLKLKAFRDRWQTSQLERSMP